MKTKLYILGAFALGVGCGIAGTYYYCQNKFNEELEEETGKLREWTVREVERRLERETADPFLSDEDKVSQDMEEESFDRGKIIIDVKKPKTTRKERTNYSSLSSIYRSEKPDLEVLAEKIRAGGEAPVEDDENVDPKFVDCYRTINDDDIDPIPLGSCEGDWVIVEDESHILKDQCLECPFFERKEANSDYEPEEDFVVPPDKTGVVFNREDVSFIEVISEEEFFNPTKTYDSESLTYYKQDDVLADEDDEVVDIEKTIGGDSLEKFEDGTVYVRNHRKQTDYEVTEVDKCYRTYVLGIGDIDDDPRGIRRRFADKEEE